jgi:hypothetical protein
MAAASARRLLLGKVRALMDDLARRFVDIDIDSPPPPHTAWLE